MNTPNPLVPQGTFPDKGKAQIRITVFAILAVHVVLLGVLLIAGCNKKTETADAAPDPTSLPPVPPPPVEPWPTQPPVPPAGATQDLAQIPPVPPAPVQDPGVLPPPPPPGVDPVLTGFTEHTIAKGESFYTLGKKYNVGYKAIADANPGVNPTRLKIGDKVKIPPAKAPGAASLNGAAATISGGDGVKTYKVKSGDNLMKIANSFGVTVKQVRIANNLKTDQIKVGQILKIPAKAPATALETVPPVPAVPPVTPPNP